MNRGLTGYGLVYEYRQHAIGTIFRIKDGVRCSRDAGPANELGIGTRLWPYVLRPLVTQLLDADHTAALVVLDNHWKRSRRVQHCDRSIRTAAQ